MNIIRIMGVDPGNNLGIGILTIDLDTSAILGVNTNFHILDSYINPLSHDTMLDRCNKLNGIITENMKCYNPLVVGLESSFMNVRFAKSVIQLSQYVMTIEMAVRNYDYWTRLFKYPPKMIKALVGAGGDAGKNDMLTNLKSKSELTKFVNLDLLTEHEIDALSIAYVTYKEIINNPYYLLTLPTY